MILAAGASTRMGSPKALTPIRGEPAIQRMVRTARAAGLDVLIVTRAGLDLPPLDARIVTNPAPEAGRTGTLQVGLASLAGPGPGPGNVALTASALVWPVDHPLAGAETLRALVAASGEWVLPAHLGRSGHPILVRGRAIDAIRDAGPHIPLRSIPPTLGIVPTRVAVDDAGILANLDTVEDVARWAT